MKPSLVLLFLLFTLCSCSEEIMKFSVSAGERNYLDCPVEVGLSSLSDALLAQEEGGSALVLYELTGSGTKKVPHQTEWTDGPSLWFVLDGETVAGSTRSFVLKKSGIKQQEKTLQLFKDQDSLTVAYRQQPLVNYRISEMWPPEGADSLYKRSAFIHPLRSLSGEVLTRVQPPDHIHHYGIWNPWTLTHVGGREVDYWNLAKGEGTVRNEGVEQGEEGPLFAQFRALHAHIDFGAGVAERVNLEEWWEGRVFGVNEVKSRYLFDLRSDFENLLDDTILFDAYRYGGGIGYRATGRWNATNCTVLTSEGLYREKADGSRARWCIVEGESGAGRSGILFLSHPGNREHPEPMRVWPEDVSGGELFFEFCPIRHVEWVILPGQLYTLQYRMVVFDGAMTPGEAEMYWNGFAYPPEVRIE